MPSEFTSTALAPLAAWKCDGFPMPPKECGLVLTLSVMVTDSAPHKRKFLVLPLAEARIIVMLSPLMS